MKTIVNQTCLRSILCVIAFLCCLTKAGAQTDGTTNYDFVVNGYFYRVTSETEKTVAITYEKTSYDDYYDENIFISGYTGSVSIPTAVTYNSQSYQVTSIDAHAFDGSSITAVSIPDCIREIGDGAFLDCRSLQSVILPQSVTSIGSGAFNGCMALTSINIPDGVTTINGSTFFYCQSLSSIIIPENVTSIGNYAFYGCIKLTSVSVESPTPVAITSTSFSNRANATLYVPAGSKAAYEAADYWKEFKEIIEMPSQLQDGDAFTAKTLEGIDMTFKVISASDRTCMVYNSSSAAISTSYEGNVTIPSVVYDYRVVNIGYRSFRRTNITSVVIPSSIDVIGAEAFEQCYKLASVVIPDGVTTIGGEAFKTCTSLESVEIAGSVNTIYDEVFKNCSKLQTVVLKDGFKKTGSSMFEKCSNLVSVDIPNSIDSIEWGTFYSCSSIATISLPQTVSSIGASAFYGCTSLNSFTIPSAINKIESSSFNGCTSLTSIVIPEGVDSIETTAFSGCTNLASINFPSTICYIGNQAFENTKWYNDKEDGIVYIGKVAYKYKGKMPERSIISIEEGTVSVSAEAFRGNQNLLEISLPQSITSIGGACFYGCSNMQKVRVGMTKPLAITSSTFTNTENMFLYVPEGSVDLYLKADIWKDFLCIKQASDPEMFSGGDGTADSPYIMNTVGDFRLLAKDVNAGNSYSGTYFKVGKTEIDFSDITYTAIGRCEYDAYGNEVPIAFSGNFDGNGVTIKNLTTNKALFGYVGKNGIVANIIIDESCKINGNTMNVAGIAGSNKGTIDNCINKAPVSCDKCHVAGICGDNMGTISNCKNYGVITCESESGMAGGIAGDLDAGKILNCENYGNVVSVGAWVGGIVGLITGQPCYVKNCLNQGNVTGPYDVGGIFGSVTYLSSTTICDNMVSDCTIKGIKGSGSDVYEAGVIGPYIESSTCSNNFYTPDVILIVGKQTYDGTTPRGTWDRTNYVPMDVAENCAAMIMPSAGTEEKPFTCAEANTFVAGLTADTPTETEYYVKGKVSTIQYNFGYQYDNATFYISDDGTKNDEFYVYRTLYFDKQNYNGGRVPNIGDEVVLCGKLTNHEGNTPETVNGECRLVSINGKTVGTGLEVGELFVAKTPEDVEMFFVVDESGKSMSKTSETGCSVGYAAANRPETGTNPPCCIDANYGGVVTIPATAEGFPIQAIAPSAFTNAKLTSVTIPATVWDIEVNAFKDCQNLASVTLPEGVILNNGTFRNCTALTSIELPKNVQLWANGAIFGGCTNLTTITVNDVTPYDLQGSYLVDDPSKVTLYVPAGSKAAYEAADYWNEFKEIIEKEANKVKLSRTKAIMPVGKTGSLKATVYPTTLEDKSVTWKSSNKKVATVTSKGKVTAVGVGTATITCTSVATGAKATCKLTVGKVDLSKTEATVAVGKSGTLKATVYPTTLEDKSVIWKSSDTEVATVTSKGKVKAVGVGTAIITCTSKATGLSATCTLTVGKVVLSKSEATVAVCKSGTLKATVYPETLADKSVTWKTSDEKVATVTSSGKVKAVGVGTAIITCTSKATGLSATCTLTVGKVVISKTKATVSVGKSGTLRATVYPETLEDKSVTWKSSNKNVATVTSKGKVTAVGVGTAIITCTSNATGLKATCTLTVTAPAAGARSLGGDDDDDATDIDEMTVAVEAFDVYDLRGRKVRHQVTSLDGLPDGIYIVNGKKVLKK